MLFSELELLKEKTLKLEERVVHRPGGNEIFASLYRELYNGANTIFSEKKTMQIIANIEENILHNASVEETWQSSTCQFIHGISKNYCGYEDITIPIFSCIYHIKQGV